MFLRLFGALFVVLSVTLFVVLSLSSTLISGKARADPLDVITGSGCKNDHLFRTKYQPQIVSLKRDISRIIEYVTVQEKGKTFRELASFVDKFGSRFTGTDNLEDSIDYMLKKLADEKHDNVYGEVVDVPRWIRGNEWAEMVQPRHMKMNILGLGYSIGTNNQTVEAEAIVVKDFDHLDRLGEKLKGKYVVYNFDYHSYGEVTKYRFGGARRAARHGAIGVFVRSLTPFSLNTPHAGNQFYEEGIPKIPAVSIVTEDANLFQRLQDSGQKIVIRHYSENRMVDGKFHSRNIVSEISGTEHPEHTVAVSGHIDSWDVGQGAMDDGGGAFISWRAISVLKALNLKPKLTLRSILWTAEEMGLLGGEQYVARHKNDSFSLVLESDTGTFEPLGVAFSGKNLTSQCILWSIMEQFPPSFNATRVRISSQGSDTAFFHDLGIPIGSLDTQNEKYFWFHHTEADTLDVVDSEQLDRNTALWTAVSYAVAMLDGPLPR